MTTSYKVNFVEKMVGPEGLELRPVKNTAFTDVGALLVRPDGELVAVGIAEVESPASGECEDLLGDLTFRLAYLRFLFLQHGVVEHDQRASSATRALHESTVEPAVVETRVVRPVIGVGPSEDVTVELLRRLDVGDRDFDVVDPIRHSLFLAHRGFLRGVGYGCLMLRTGVLDGEWCRFLLCCCRQHSDGEHNSGLRKAHAVPAPLTWRHPMGCSCGSWKSGDIQLAHERVSIFHQRRFQFFVKSFGDFLGSERRPGLR